MLQLGHRKNLYLFLFLFLNAYLPQSHNTIIYDSVIRTMTIINFFPMNLVMA